ncbi:MAG: inner membrane protein [Crocinitomicaceae bacterium]|jgi:inner membrane protein
MDSLTQIVLGAAVGEAVLGKKIGSRAMLWGAIAGTIPDLDVFLKYFVDDITSTEMHRGFSHSIAFSLIFAPILAWIALKIHKRRDATRRDWTWLFFLSLVTHPLLDMHTTWGTQFFWPFEVRITYKNIFVVDPLYTIPFLICVIIALCYKRSNPWRRVFNYAGIFISTSYMALTFAFKWFGYQAFEQGLEKQDIAYVEMDTKPTPLNSVLWNAQVETKDGYRFAYYSIFDSQEEITFSHEFQKNHHLLNPIKDQHVVKQILKIADGWYVVDKDTTNDHLIFTDLRFGQFGMDQDNAPFMWKYDISIDAKGKATVKRLQPSIDNMGEVFSELWERMKGN